MKTSLEKKSVRITVFSQRCKEHFGHTFFLNLWKPWGSLQCWITSSLPAIWTNLDDPAPALIWHGQSAFDPWKTFNHLISQRMNCKGAGHYHPATFYSNFQMSHSLGSPLLHFSGCLFIFLCTFPSFFLLKLTTQWQFSLNMCPLTLPQQ